jgi:hypothetical protein
LIGEAEEVFVEIFPVDKTWFRKLSEKVGGVGGGESTERSSDRDSKVRPEE